MSEPEIRRMTRIMMTADGGCGTCAERLIGQMVKAYPDTNIVATEVFKEEYEDFDGDWEVV